MIVYADILFLINFLSCYILIGIMCRFKQKKIPKKRKLLSSLCGGCAAMVIFILDLEHYIVSAILFFSSVGIVFICFGKKALVMNMAIFLVLFMLYGGVVTTFVSLLGGSTNLFIKNNIIYFDINTGIFAISFICAYPLVCFFFKLIQKHSKRRLHSLMIINKGQSICVDALFDSGNLLKDPISGKDVIILEEAQAKKIVTQNEDFFKIPFSTISGSDTMDAFVADMIIIDDKHILKKQYIGMVKGSLSNTDEYCALIGNMGGL